MLLHQPSSLKKYLHSLLKAILLHAISNLPFIYSTLGYSNHRFYSPFHILLFPHSLLQHIVPYNTPSHLSKCIPPHLNPIMFLPLHHDHYIPPPAFLPSLLVYILFPYFPVFFQISAMQLAIVNFVLTWQMCYRIHYMFIFKARHTYLSM